MTPGPRPSRLRVGQLFAASMSLLAIVGVAGLVAGLVALDDLADERRRIIDRLDPAYIATQELITAFSDQESGVLGFAATRADPLLELYRRGRRDAAEALEALERATGGRRQTTVVVAAAQRWIREYAEPAVAAVRRGAPAKDRPRALDGFRRAQAVRAAAAAYKEDLGAERAAARERVADLAVRVRWIVIAYALGILVSALLAGAVLRRTVVVPLGRLASEVRGVVRGAFDRRVRTDGAREIIALGEDVDAMRARIAAEVQELEEARDELARSNAELEQFAYVASHDLQEPLRKVASFTQMLQSRYGGQLDARADTYIEFAVDGAKRMQELINDLLAFSRVGRITEPARRVDCNELVEAALQAQAAAIEETGAEVDVGELPPVMGEPLLLELVFANLIGNGIKFRGAEPPRISVRARRQDGEWCFTVADNGIGIDAEYADRIFVIFQRLHPRSAYAGTGIGLAMCRKIVEYHGGHIWYDAGDGPGATFRFTLPAIEEER
jgi:signal transduction histidine kinase